MSTRFIESLRGIFPPENILTEDIDVIPYSVDGTPALSSKPVAVVLPRNSLEVSRLIALCAEDGVAVSTRGSGTGLAGGCLPSPGGIVLSLAKFDRILDVDRKNLCLLAEAGATTSMVSEAAAREGLFYPPDPSSMKISTIGGNVANNSGGLRGLKYGVTRDYVMGMEVILANGSVTWLGSKCVKDVAGFSLKDLFIGSEGTLGVITKVLLRLVPKPAAKRTITASFEDLEKASEAVAAIIAHPVIPCTLEFLDRTTIRAVEDFAMIGLPVDAGAMLLMETDGHPEQVREEAEAMARIAREYGAINVTEAATAMQAESLSKARRTALSALARIRPTTILEDVTVPRSCLPEMVRRIDGISKRHSVKTGVFGHFGDGNIHPVFLTDERDVEEMRRVELAMKEVFEAAVDLGGTITGEHGVGIAKKPYLPMQFGKAEMSLMHAVKKSIDPLGILNPGKIFDPPHDRQNPAHSIE